MAVSAREDAVVASPYVATLGFSGGAVPQYLLDELRRVALCTDELAELAVTMADAAPSSPRVGTLRFPKVADWDPLGMGTDQQVYWDGSNWKSTTRIAEGTWETAFQIGPNRLWTDSTGALRGLYNADPTTDTDGERILKELSNPTARFGTALALGGGTNGTGVNIKDDGQIIAYRTGFSALQIGRPSGTGTVADFRDGATVKGTIATTALGVNYNTTSDYRAKRNLKAAAPSATVALFRRLKVWDGEFKTSPGNRQHLLLAHELQEVLPDAVCGQKDEVDSDGNPVLQGVDHSKLVPLLVATVQLLLERVETLENSNRRQAP